MVIVHWLFARAASLCSMLVVRWPGKRYHVLIEQWCVFDLIDRGRETHLGTQSLSSWYRTQPLCMSIGLPRVYNWLFEAASFVVLGRGNEPYDLASVLFDSRGYSRHFWQNHQASTLAHRCSQHTSLSRRSHSLHTAREARMSSWAAKRQNLQ